MHGWIARPKARQIIGRAFKSSWQIVRAMPWLLPFTVIAFAIISIATVKISNLLPASMADEAVWAEASRIRGLSYIDLVPLQLLELPELLLKALIGAVPGVLVSRFILLGEITPSSLSKLAPIIWRFALWTFALDAWFLLWCQADYLTDSLWNIGLMLVATVPAYFLLALVFPGIAIGVEYRDIRARAAAGLRHMRGNFWLLLRAIGPLLVLVMIVTFILNIPNGQSYQDPIAQGKTLTSWKFLGWEAVAISAAEVVCAAVSAWLYAWAATHHTEKNS